MDSKDSLTFKVASTAPGQEISLGILRDGKALDVRLRVELRPENLGVRGGAPAPREGTLRGITVQNLTPALRDQLGVPGEVEGVVISSLAPDSPAAQEGLQSGDVIMDIDRHAVHNAGDFSRLAAHASGQVLVRIYRQGATLFVVLSPVEGEGQ